MRTQTVSSQQVCIIGNFNIDLIIRNVPHLPRWGQEVAGDNYRQYSSGQGGYSCFALRQLGVPVTAIGYVGEDLYGQQIVNDLSHQGVDTTGMEVVRGERTAITVAIVRPDGERAFVSDFTFQQTASEAIIQRHWSQVQQSACVCLLGVFCLPGFNFSTLASLLRQMQEQGHTTLVDTGWDPADWTPEHLNDVNLLLKYTSLFMPNLDEARAITGCESPEEAAADLHTRGAQHVIIKLGKDGSYANIGGRTYRQPALPVDVYDAVGAGDVFNAGFLYGFTQQWPIERCLMFANAASALYISRADDRFPSQQQVAARAAQYQDF
ncbi:hypothetical protein GF339_21455 [candidate division KSB3 bacterium]|uniref:Carbohydrate kinase PfkB domain-containing protein n=1 Tax=candidate division KSB3 bacterium TaxID=2044937 RepID=A0A9D5JZJ7_9BACT|nr:hypothetical protein [candidate division KSB3 bacterium]MBD3327167.1 hypothetical protein [candidate division KSB3 bacterium]